MGDEVDRGFVSREDQEQGVAREHALGHPPLRAVLVHQCREHARAGLLGVPVEQLGCELPELPHGLAAPDLAAPDLLRGGLGTEVQSVQSRLDPVVEASLVLQRHAQNLADHRHRQGIGEVVDGIDAGLAAHAVQKIDDDTADLGLQVGDQVRRMGRADEVRHHRPAVTVVLGRIAGDDVRLGQHFPDRLGNGFRRALCPSGGLDGHFRGSELTRGSCKSATISR
ncbi:hypothetical protein [Streptomyces sp. NPDC001269]